MTAKQVLIVDDEPGILETLSGVLGDEGYEVRTTASGEEAPAIYTEQAPDVVFLDIWLPDRDGLETLQALRAIDPTAAVVMISGHGTSETAVKAMKMGAFDYLEKPLSINKTIRAVEGAIEYRASLGGDAALLERLERTVEKIDQKLSFEPPQRLKQCIQTDIPQRSIASATVLYGLGLHSGRRTGMSLQPLPPNSGIHFLSLPGHIQIPAHVSQVAETDYATTIQRDGVGIKTVEHLMSALHVRGITNLLIKVHGEIPVLDGSSLEFCDAIDEAGVEDQDEGRWELVIDRPYRIERPGGGYLEAEPDDGFEVSYHLDYPEPVGVQDFGYRVSTWEDYRREVAPARTFGFMRDMKMMAELGLGTGGRLDNCILVGEEGAINTELRFDDEMARHKVLDIVGDVYLLGFPIRGRIHGSLSGHKTNIALLRELLSNG